jgi:hypothetical protein
MTYSKGMFFAPTVVDQAGYIPNVPNEEEKQLNKSKGEMLFHHIYRRDKNNPLPPCFTFIDDRPENCQSVFDEAKRLYISAQTFQIDEPTTIQ